MRSGKSRVFKEGEIDAYYERQGKTRPSERVKYSKVERLVRRRKEQLAALKKEGELMAWRLMKRKFDELGASVVDSLATGSRAEREWREDGERPARGVRVRT